MCKTRSVCWDCCTLKWRLFTYSVCHGLADASIHLRCNAVVFLGLRPDMLLWLGVVTYFINSQAGAGYLAPDEFAILLLLVVPLTNAAHHPCFVVDAIKPGVLLLPRLLVSNQVSWIIFLLLGPSFHIIKKINIWCFLIVILHGKVSCSRMFCKVGIQLN